MWVALAFAVGVVMLCIEAFVPGGVFGVVGAVAIFVSIVLGFTTFGAGTGLLIASGELLTTVVLFATWLAVFPKTRIGRSMILNTTLSAEQGYSGTSDILGVHAGQMGMTETTLRPAGIVRVDGRRVHAESEGVYIEQGGEVKIVSVEGNRIIVRPIASADDDSAA